MNKNNGHSFLKGAIVLSIGMIFVKVIGAFFKLPLANIIGENGMGYFNTAYNFYAVFFSLATAGFPVAIARLVAQNYSLKRYNDVRKIKDVALPIFVVLGLVFTGIMILGAKAYTNFIGNSGAYLPIIVLAPTIFFCCLSAIYRGYFEGLRNMYPTAISEVLEALCKLFIGISLALVALKFFSDEYSEKQTVLGNKLNEENAKLAITALSASGAIIGVTVGSFVSLAYLAIKNKLTGDFITPKMLKNSPKAFSKRHIATQLVQMAIPIAIGSLALSLAGLVDQTFLQKRISDLIVNQPEFILDMYNGLIPQENLENLQTIPNFLFGCFAYASTIFTLVPAATQGFAVSALPNLTNAWVKNDKKLIEKSVNGVIKTTCICAMPAGLGIMALSHPIVNLLYGKTSGGAITGNVLCVLGLASIFCALSAPLSAVLQGIGRVDLPVKILLVGLFIKIVLNYVLCGMPQVNIHGAGFSTLACYFVISITQMCFIKKCTKIKINVINTIIKPLFSAIACASVAIFTYSTMAGKILNSNVLCVVSIIAGGIIYVILLLLSGCVPLNKVFITKK